MLRFDNLQTPPDDGGILLEPSPVHWPSLLEQNARRLERCDCALAGVPVRQVREAVRSQLVGENRDKNIITAGHQPEFVHPGVWAKHVAVRAFARSVGLIGIDLVVDNDAPRSRSLRVPVSDDTGLVAVREIPFTTAPAGSAYEGCMPVSKERVQGIIEELSAVMGRRFDESLMAAYLDGLAGFVGSGDAVDQHLASRLRIDTVLGADLPEHRVSKVVGGAFVADLLLNADRFASAYNQSLADYRREQGVHSPDRPLPDLHRRDGRVETALWIYQPRQRRHRLWVEPHGDGIRFHADETLVGELGMREMGRDFGAASTGLLPWVIRPRALTLTLWARLLACDLFVHGIGGAKYDRITDGILRRYYACDPPAYVCVSATLWSPWPILPVTAADLTVAARKVRDWRFNPHWYCPDLSLSLLAERANLIRRSEELRQTHGPRPQRREVFAAIRMANARLVDSHPEIAPDLAGRCGLISCQIESNRLAAGREYFYALQPRERLETLAERVAQAI